MHSIDAPCASTAYCGNRSISRLLCHVQHPSCTLGTGRVDEWNNERRCQESPRSLAKTVLSQVLPAFSRLPFFVPSTATLQPGASAHGRQRVFGSALIPKLGTLRRSTRSYCSMYTIVILQPRVSFYICRKKRFLVALASKSVGSGGDARNSTSLPGIVSDSHEPTIGSACRKQLAFDTTKQRQEKLGSVTICPVSRIA